MIALAFIVSGLSLLTLAIAILVVLYIVRRLRKQLALMKCRAERAERNEKIAQQTAVKTHHQLTFAYQESADLRQRNHVLREDLMLRQRYDNARRYGW